MCGGRGGTREGKGKSEIRRAWKKRGNGHQYTGSPTVEPWSVCAFVGRRERVRSLVSTEGGDRTLVISRQGIERFRPQATTEMLIEEKNQAGPPCRKG